VIPPIFRQQTVFSLHYVCSPVARTLTIWRVIDCTLVTCEKVADLDPDDRLLMGELQRRGLTVSIETWSDPHAQWGASRLCIVRSTWDYHERYDEFIAWLSTRLSHRIENDPHVLRWNAHKSYLKELGRLGVPIVPTAWVARGEPCDLAELAEARGWHDMVLQARDGCRGASSDARPSRRRVVCAGQAQFGQLAQTQDVLVQPYLRSVVDWGERALIFFSRTLLARRPQEAIRYGPRCRHSIVAGRAET